MFFHVFLRHGQTHLVFFHVFSKSILVVHFRHLPEQTEDMQPSSWPPGFDLLSLGQVGGTFFGWEKTKRVYLYMVS